MMMNNLKLGLDIHGVLDNNPEFFSTLSTAVVNSGGQVHIITGESMTKELKTRLLNFHPKKLQYWTHFFSIEEHLLEKEEKYTELDNKLYFDKLKWDKAKADYCHAQEISMHVDDRQEYLKFFKTPFLYYESN